MKRNKKVFLILVFIVLTVFAVGTISVTYAWFLSRYEHRYSFILESDSNVILSYESGISFQSGDIDTNTNILIPAVRTAGGAAIDEEALAPFDMFGAVAPAANAKLTAQARAIKFKAKGAYWTGKGTTNGQFSFCLEGYLSTVVVGEREKDGVNDLVGSKRNELDYIVIFDYFGEKILLCEGAYYLYSNSANDLILPVGLESTYRNWQLLTSADRISYGTASLQLVDANGYLLLQPNTTFEYTLYVFLAKAETEFDPAINGQSISLKATLTVN